MSKINIKILEVFGKEWYDDTFDHICYHLHNFTEWEDIAEEEVNLLKAYIEDHNNKNRNPKYILITEASINIKKTVADYLKIIKEKEEQLIKKQRVIEERRKTRELNKMAKDKNRKMELYNKLKEELKDEFSGGS